MTNFVAGNVFVKTENISEIADDVMAKIAEILGSKWCSGMEHDVFVVVLNGLARAVKSDKGE
jgi:hypothetical protein